MDAHMHTRPPSHIHTSPWNLLINTPPHRPLHHPPPADLCQPRTSANRHLASPAAIRAADAVLRSPREEITRVTGVYQSVAVGGQVETRNVSIGRAPRLLAGVG